MRLVDELDVLVVVPVDAFGRACVIARSVRANEEGPRLPVVVPVGALGKARAMSWLPCVAEEEEELKAVVDSGVLCKKAPVQLKPARGFRPLATRCGSLFFRFWPRVKGL